MKETAPTAQIGEPLGRSFIFHVSGENFRFYIKMEKFPLQKIKRRRRSQALQNAPLLGNLNHFFISQAVQISLRDTDILVTQKTADGIEVCSHFDLLLGKEVTAG